MILQVMKSRMSIKSKNTCFDKALKYLSYKPRTEFEIKRYLIKNKFNETEIIDAIGRLRDSRYIDDENYARMFCENRVRYKPKSVFALSYELRGKGVSDDTINIILSEYKDVDLAKKSIELKLNLWIDLDDDLFKKKIMNFLQYRGFSYEICISTFNFFKNNRTAT